MSTDTDDNVERSVVLWHLQVCMATFYTQNYPKETNKRKPYQSVQFTDTAYCSHEKLNLFTIAAPIRYFNHLTSIQLEDNQLTRLPRELWQLSGLQKLNLGRNALTELPADLGLLTGLKELYLHENQLKDLPSQIGRLVDLRVLDLTNNTAMTFMPWEITRLSSSLHRLWIEGTGLLASNIVSMATQRQVPSLFSLCAQLTGSSVAPTLIDSARLPLSSLSFLLSEMDFSNGATTTTTTTTTAAAGVSAMEEFDVDSCRTSSIARRCSICETILYYPGIPLLEAHGEFGGQTIPLLYHACSQTCRNRWLGRTKQGSTLVQC